MSWYLVCVYSTNFPAWCEMIQMEVHLTICSEEFFFLQFFECILKEFPLISAKSVIDICLVCLSSRALHFYFYFIYFFLALSPVFGDCCMLWKPLTHHKLDIASFSIIVKRSSWQTRDPFGVVLCSIQCGGFWKWFWAFTQLADRSERKSHAWQILALQQQLWNCIRSSYQLKWWSCWIFYISSSCFPSGSVCSCWCQTAGLLMHRKWPLTRGHYSLWAWHAGMQKNRAESAAIQHCTATSS